MKKVLISIENNNLKLSYKNHHKMREDLINTNIISDNELIFGLDYLKNNQKIVSLFIKELCEMKKLTKVVIDNNELTSFLLPFFKNISSIETLEIKSDETITFTICEEIIASNYIKTVNCYNIPSYMLEMLDRNYIKVESRSEFFYISNFMQENNLIQYSKIYYKTNVRITLPLSEEDRIDFISFTKINRYLKNIRISSFIKDDIEFLLKTLKENHLKGVLIQIPGQIIQDNQVEYLKELNKNWKKYHLKCTLNYSEDYLKENIFKQLIINTMKICGIIIFILVGSVIAYIGTRNYIAMKKVTSIQENIEQIIQSNVLDSNIKNDDDHIIKNNYIASLLAINEDTIGWLKINNTNIDYPVVKGQDNEFYLKNNLYKDYDINGWIYMDYRNNEKELNKNTIIYGHNMYYSGVMFGTLHKVANRSWYTNDENTTISFNTMYETMNWKIFSIYKIDKTSDYLMTNFATEEDFQNYINLVKNRSIHNFEIEINNDDHILTLSTCTGDNQRFVVHAKLIS
ncbi:MAG: class B sortase [Bacilli bacterium]|jgi:sortase B|nr:class B sortase [Bacilli bacterium]